MMDLIQYSALYKRGPTGSLLFSFYSCPSPFNVDDMYE